MKRCFISPSPRDRRRRIAIDWRIASFWLGYAFAIALAIAAAVA